MHLRDARPEDEEMIRLWRNSPHVSKHFFADQPISAEEHARWFRAALTDERRKCWVIRHDDEDVGVVNLYDIDRKNRRCSWGFYIGKLEARGRGLGALVEFAVLSHVFDILGLNRLYCDVLATNTSVLRAHKRFGFIEEGRLRQHGFKNGKPVDAVVLGILKDEWIAAKPGLERRLARLEQRLRASS